jgi:hypothetical protein
MSRSLLNVALFLLWMGSGRQGVAQVREPSLPPAPSAQLTAQQEEAKKQFDFKLLVRRSKMFPDLAATEKPLSAKQKLQLSVSDSLSLAAVGAAGFSAGLSQARDSLPGYGQGAEGYGKRFGAAMATSSTTQFFGTFLFATAFGQDPRFFVRENSNLRQSVRSGLRRLVITRTDQGGETLNTSGLLGPLVAQTLANTYLPDEERTTARTFQRYGTYLALRAGVNITKQYWPTIFKNLAKGKRKKNSLPAKEKAGLSAEQRESVSIGHSRIVDCLD